MPVDIQVGEPQARARRLLQLSAGLALSLDEVVVPVVSLGDSDQPPFRTNNRGWVSDGDNGVAAVAAQFAHVGIRNPNPGVLAVITGFRVRNTVAGTRVLGRYATGFFGAAGVVCVDVETPLPTGGGGYVAAGPQVQAQNSAATPVGSVIWVGHPPATYDLDKDVRLVQPFVLFPPDRISGQVGEFILSTDTVATGLFAQFFGYAYIL